MRLLVTGCTGFIGSHLTRRLLSDGHTVIGLVRDPARLAPDLAGRVQVLRGDLGLFDDPGLVLAEVDVVIHLAAVIAGKDDAEYAAINFTAVESLLSALRRQSWRPRRFVFASSLAAAGPNHADRPHDEADDTDPIDPYGRAKRDAERLLSRQPFATTAFRPPIVLGPGDPATLTLYKLARTGFAFLPAGEAQRLSFVAVDDLVDAIARMSADASEAHRVYYATSERVITNGELLEAIARAMRPGASRPLRIVPIPRFLLWAAMWIATAAARVLPFTNQLDRKQLDQMLAPSFVCTSARLTTDTGWVAQTSLEQVVADAVRGYRERGEL